IGRERAAAEVVDHRRVVHRLAPAQRQNLVESKGGEPPGCDRGQVGPRALDPEHARLPARAIDDGARATAAPAPLVGDRPIASSPSAIACTTMLPIAVASSGPASTGRPVASAVQRQRSSFRAPPPTTWISGGDEPVAPSSSPIVCRYFNARLSKMQRTTAPGS